MEKIKKPTAFLLSVLMSLALYACSAGQSIGTQTTAAPTAEITARPSPTEETPAASPENDLISGRVTVSFERENETVYDDADPEQLLLTYGAVTPRVRVAGKPEVEAKINLALEAEQRHFKEGGDASEGLSGRDGYLAAAREELAARREYSNTDGFMGYSMERSAAVQRCDERVLSLSFTESGYTGGAHGYAFTTGLTFDLTTGEILTLGDLTEDEAVFRELCADMLWEQSRSGENTVRAMGGYYDDYEAALPGLLREGNWYFDGEGLTVIANQYEIAPYAAGIIFLTLPYDWLKWQIKEEYVPEESQPDGTIDGTIYRVFDGATFEVDDNTNGEGACVVFSAEGTVEDLTLSRADFWEYSMCFTPGAPLFYADRLAGGETLLIRTWIPDAAPNLMISFRGAEGTHRFLISQSGYDGSLLLLDADAMAPLPMEITDRTPFDYDLDGDGQKETVDLVNSGTEDMPRWQVTVNGSALPEAYGGTLWQPELWLADLDYDGKAEIFLSGDMGSDDDITCAWRGDTHEAILFTGECRRGADALERTPWADGRAVFCGGLYLDSWSYQLGTYGAVREYRFTDGVIAPTVNAWSSFNGWNYLRNRIWLTIKRELPCVLDDGTETALSPGKQILLTGTDGEHASFRTEDGRTGILTLKWKDDDGFGGWTIRGVPEDEYFDFLPYVG